MCMCVCVCVHVCVCVCMYVCNIRDQLSTLLVLFPQNVSGVISDTLEKLRK